ncbi:hypothetical protein SEA_RYADEL_29 [Mycobacterium phage Ryadel]|uniref:Uncharacterized protein n=2 Tax=Corndogvirus TaxID=1623285 RepID=A0A345MF01_9CAUD|nr:hypothetical protein PBI_CATDAWG_26 [Mycobacterium phage Catdawg]YP_010097519.1 hypothetical protein KNU03_gp029 [Mycobacterium phage Ryadel]ATW60509.1 hypothetical protein SEA_FAMILTON_27 [Mycobacterium phage Familton]AVI04057.1 hypothetical protein SEA_JANGDYNASTY_26 [Mycobacterium phage JangDynasty]AVP42681.1 hypothetical protein SEA_SCHOOLBUS_26 [Mycobacterium phage SchoolBus]QGJ87349.1 hypothetical protein SEA_BLESSICA_27 [Mycobacterium phage Blessica]QOC58459.1 hypothetical protein S
MSSGIRTATVYRTEARALKPEVDARNYGEPDQPQFLIAAFPDGKVAQRWLIGSGSCVWWDDLAHLYSVHIYPHPDYGTEVHWDDGHVERL